MLDVIPDRLGEREVTRQNDLARLVRLAAELRRGKLGRVRRLPRGALRQPRRPRRSPADLPPGEGPRVRRRLPPAPRGARAAVEALEDRRRDRRGAAAALRRPDAGEAPPDRDLVGQAEPLPGRARDRDARRAAAKAGRAGRSRSTTRSRRWRLETAKAEERPAYVIFHNSTLAEIVRRCAAQPGRARRRCRASAPRSSSATATRCSPCSPPGPDDPGGRASTDVYGAGHAEQQQLPGLAHVRDARVRARRRLDLPAVRLDVDEERAWPEGGRGVDDAARLPRADRQVRPQRLVHLRDRDERASPAACSARSSRSRWPGPGCGRPDPPGRGCCSRSSRRCPAGASRPGCRSRADPWSMSTDRLCTVERVVRVEHHLEDAPVRIEAPRAGRPAPEAARAVRDRARLAGVREVDDVRRVSGRRRCPRCG